MPRGLLAVIIGCSLGLITLVSGPTAVAQNTPRTGQVRSQAGDSLRISPVRSDITVQPGQSTRLTVYVQNLSPNRVTLRAYNNDFIAGGKEDGTPNIILEDNQFAPTHSLKRFMRPINNVTVAPNERKPVDVNITVPATAQSGGYFGAIRFAPANTSNSSQVNVSGSVASLILLTVPGDLVERLELKTFEVQQNTAPKVDGKQAENYKAGQRFGSPEQLRTVLRLENKGNVQLAPFGEVFVRKGNDVIYKATLNDVKPAGQVLPDSVRRFAVPLKGLENFGKYKISAVIGYGGSNQTLEVEKTIWIIPDIYILLFIIGLIIIVSLILLMVHRFNKRRRHGNRRFRQR